MAMWVSATPLGSAPYGGAPGQGPRQVYVVVWQRIEPATLVLLAQKKVWGTRFNGNWVEPGVLNYAGQWVFPGGGVNRDEQPEDAAWREFFEETGIDLGQPGYVLESSFVADAHHGILYVKTDKIGVFMVEINRNIIEERTLDDELQRVKWIDARGALIDLQYLNWYPQADDVEQELQRRGGPDYRDRSWFTGAINRLLR